MDYKQKLYLDIALLLNSEIYKEKHISLFTYEKVQKELLKRIKTYDNKK